MGTNTKMIITGDMTQIDLPPSQKTGLMKHCAFSKGMKGITFIELNEKDIIRHKLVKRIVDAYEKSKKKRKPHGQRKAINRGHNPKKYPAN